jgi:hypothetical protein
LGVTVEQFQAMQIAAEEAGIGTDTLAHATEKLAMLLNQAREGSKDAIDKLLTLGITTKQINDPLFTIVDLLGQERERLENGNTAHETRNALLQVLGARMANAIAAIKEFDGSEAAVQKTMDNINGLNEKQIEGLKAQGAAWGILGKAISNTVDKLAYFFNESRKNSPGLEAPDQDSLYQNLPQAQAPQPTLANDAAGAAAEHGASQREEANKEEAQDWAILQQKMLEQELENIKAGIEATKQGSIQRLEAVRSYAATAAKLYGDDSPATKQANEKAIAEQRSYNEQQKAGMEELSNFAEDLENQVHAMHDKSVLEQSKTNYEAVKKQERDLQELSDFSVELYTHVHEQAATLQHQLGEINAKIKGDFQAKWKGVADTMTNSISGALTNMITHTKTFQQEMQSIFQSLVGGIIKHFVAMGVSWAETQIENMIISRGANKEIGNSLAGQAGAAGVASFAAAPWPLDLGAPAFGAAMFAAAQSYAVAEKGYDVPSGVNPMTQLHAREMVLPATLADTVRNMASGGRGEDGGGGSSYHTHQWSINALDGHSVERVFNDPSNRKKIERMAQSHINRLKRR